MIADVFSMKHDLFSYDGRTLEVFLSFFLSRCCTDGVSFLQTTLLTEDTLWILTLWSSGFLFGLQVKPMLFVCDPQFWWSTNCQCCCPDIVENQCRVSFHSLHPLSLRLPSLCVLNCLYMVLFFYLDFFCIGVGSLKQINGPISCCFWPFYIIYFI